MSAFVVDTLTMDHILTGFPTLAGADPTQIGRELFTMNVAAVQQRYPDTVADPENMPGPHDAATLPSTYVFTPQQDVSPIQALKSLHCFTYQCAEGDVPNTALYRALAALEERADPGKHIEGSPAYNAAAWG